jgi:rod shape-determining protein MreC
VSNVGASFDRGALIDAGEAQGLKAGYPVVSAKGLVGRLVAVGNRSARLLLLTDSTSRIPVVIGAEAARAVVEGDNGPLLKLAFLQPGHPVKPGDEVLTSGVGGQLPRGLRIGTIVDSGDGLRVELAAQLDRLQYVGVLFYDVQTPKSSGEEPAVPRNGFSGRLVPSQSTSKEGALPK